jgi:hypothetical protein
MLESMRVKIGELVIEPPALTLVSRRGIGFPGFEFEGLAPEEEGKRIVERLKSLKQQGLVECEAVTREGHHLSGFGKLESFESETSTEAPVVYRFSAVVEFVR